MKTAALILASLCCLVSLAPAQAAPLKSHFPPAGLGQFLAERLDLASFRNSLGPRRTPASRTFADLNMTPTKATDNELEFDTPDWYLRLRITGRRDANGDGIEDLEICFTDQGRDGATYLSQDSLLVTRYSDDGYAVALHFGADACGKPALEAQPPSASAQDPALYERIGRFIYAFHRSGLSVEALTSQDLAHNAPAALSSRARSLASKFEAIVKAPQAVPEAELQATLREAAMVSAALRDWRQTRGQ